MQKASEKNDDMEGMIRLRNSKDDKNPQASQRKLIRKQQRKLMTETDFCKGFESKNSKLPLYTSEGLKLFH